MITPDYRNANDASTNDGRVTAWGLTDVAFELRTANLIAFLQMTPHTPEGEVVREPLSRMIADRLGLLDEGWNQS